MESKPDGWDPNYFDGRTQNSGDTQALYAWECLPRMSKDFQSVVNKATTFTVTPLTDGER